MTPDQKGITWDDEQPQGVQWDDEPRTNTLGQEAARQGGLTARYLVEAAASPLVIGGDLIGKGINALTGQETVKPYLRVLKQALDKYLPTPERPLEQFTQAVAQTAPAAALPASLPAQVGGNAAIGAALRNGTSQPRSDTAGGSDDHPASSAGADSNGGESS